MNEIEYRVERACYYQKCLFNYHIDSASAWCLLVGLWETGSWVCNKNTKSPPILEWLEPGRRYE